MIKFLLTHLTKVSHDTIIRVFDRTFLNKIYKRFLSFFDDSLFYSFVVMLLVRTFFIDYFWVPTSSMAPRIFRGDAVIVARYRYGISPLMVAWDLGRFLVKRERDPITGKIKEADYEMNCNLKIDRVPYIKFRAVKKGDIVSFMHPNGLTMTKQVVALSGDELRMDGSSLVIDGEMCEKKLIGEFLYRDEYGIPVIEDLYLERLPKTGCKYIIQEARDVPIQQCRTIKPSGEVTNFVKIKPAEIVRDPLGREVEMLWLGFVGRNRCGSADSRTGETIPPSVPESWVMGATIGIIFSTNNYFVQHSSVSGDAVSWRVWLLCLPFEAFMWCIAILTSLERVGLIFPEEHRQISPKRGFLTRSILGDRKTKHNRWDAELLEIQQYKTRNLAKALRGLALKTYEQADV